MSGDPIADYLAGLRAGLRTSPARTAEILAEAEDHLRESAAAGRGAGLGEEAAQHAAISAFGPVEQVSRAHRPSASAHAAAVGLRAWPLLGGYLLLSGLIGGLMLWDELVTSHGHSMVPAVAVGGFGRQTTYVLDGRPHTEQVAATIGGCVVAGVLLLAGFLIVRRHRRRRSGAAPATLPRGLALLISVAALLALGIAGYLFFSGDVMGRLHIPDGAAELLLGSQWAAVLMGIGWALRTLASLVNWVVTSRRGRGRQMPPEGRNLAPVG